MEVQLLVTVDAMVEQVYDSLNKYFTHLENVGYMSQPNVDKLLVLALVQEFIDNDFRGYLNKEDYSIIGQALYCIYGTTCLIPYPDYYNCKTRRVMYTGSCSELAHKVDTLEAMMLDGCCCCCDDGEIIIPSEQPPTPYKKTIIVPDEDEE